MKYIILALFLTSCFNSKESVTVADTPAESSATVSKSKITVMTFNVENLFDTKDDKYKSDETYLPMSQKKSKSHKDTCNRMRSKRWRKECLYKDWSEKAYRKKLDKIAEVIKSANSNQLPDVVVLQEVENLRALKDLNKKLGLKHAVLIEGRDIRGIDVAVLSNLKILGKPKQSFVPFSKISKRRSKDTRGILQVKLELPNKETLTVYGVHFPAPYHPYKLRLESLKFLEGLRKKDKSDYQLAAGDFNIPASEAKRLDIYGSKIKPNWDLAHLYCKKCKGTNYYSKKNSWSFLDMILLSGKFINGSKGWKLNKKSVRTGVFLSDQKKSNGAPRPYDEKKGKGLSDHFPLIVDLVLAQ